MFDKGDCSVTASDPREVWGPSLEDSSLWGAEGANDLIQAGWELDQRPLEISSGCCGPVEERGWREEQLEVKGSGVGRMPKLCFALKEGWRQNFLSFALLQQWRYIPVCGVSCSIGKSEMLLPDKPFYECWKPVQREQRRLLFFSQWVEPRERRGAPAGCRLESLLEKNSKAQKKIKIRGCSLNKMGW